VSKSIAVLCGFCLCLGLAAPSLAGIAHTGNQLVCSDCHTMHYSAHHNYKGGPTDLVVDPTGPFPDLLKAAPNDLCLACHDGTGVAPDVLGVQAEDYPRQAGALTQDGMPEPGYNNWDGHTLGSKDTAPGGTWSNPTFGLSCSDCHSPHGEATQFRNLCTSTDPGDKFQNKDLTFSFGSTNDLTKDVYLHGGFDTSHRYGIYGTDFNEPDPTKSAYGEWCASCHGNYHGSGGNPNVGGATGGNPGSSPWKRHPVADVNIGAHYGSSLTQYQSHANRVKVMSSSGNWDSGTDLTPSCFSCHKAHGNKNPFGLIYMSGAGTVTEEGDTGGGSLNDLCIQCHAS
jgi:hypothetical protein